MDIELAVAKVMHEPSQCYQLDVSVAHQPLPMMHLLQVAHPHRREVGYPEAVLKPVVGGSGENEVSVAS